MIVKKKKINKYIILYIKLDLTEVNMFLLLYNTTIL